MVSVIVPVYNGEGVIEACLRSAAAQTDGDLEILVIDDGSTDNTPALCRALAAADPRIRLFRQENAGVSAARNRGLGEAKGEYVTFLDADDLLLPSAVAILRNAAQSGADMVIGSYEAFRAGMTRRVVYGKGAEPEALAGLVSGKLYRRAMLEANGIRFPTGVPYGEDTIFNLRCFQSAGRPAVLEEVVCRRRLGGAASSLRYYPNRSELAAGLIEAYCAYYGGKEKIPARIAEKELEDTIAHYLVHCRPREAGAKAEEAVTRLQPYLGRPIDGKSTIKSVLRTHWRRIALRKLKRKAAAL